MTRDSVEKLAEEIRSRALKNGASDAEASVRYVDSSRIEVNEGKVEGIRRSRETVAALRVIVEGRPGFSFSTDPGRESIEGMVRDALDGARLLPPDENNRFSSAGSPAMVEGILDREGFDRPFEDKLDCARVLESAALAADDKVKKTHKPSFGENFRISAIASGDMVWSYEDTLFSVGVEAVAEDNGTSQTGYDYSVSKF
ncbi:MAG: PmbA/TldA family metallopeptidase, partial [bacterium]